MKEIIDTFSAVNDSLKIQSIHPILQGNDNVIHGYKVVFEGTDNWIDGGCYNHYQLCRLLKLVPLMVLERVDISGVGATHFTPSKLSWQDPWHRDVFDPWDNSTMVMKMQKGVTRNTPTYFSLEDSVRKAIQKYLKKRGDKSHIHSLMQFQSPFLIDLAQMILREMIQKYDKDFTQTTFGYIPQKEKYFQDWRNPEYATTILVRNNNNSPILHARPEEETTIDRSEIENPLAVFQMEDMSEAFEHLN